MIDMGQIAYKILLGVQQCFGVVVYHELTTLRRVYFATARLPEESKPVLALLIHDYTMTNTLLNPFQQRQNKVI